MENRKFCQSCSMPLDNPEFLGTEKDGSKNQEYCKYCYRNGAFIYPNMTLADMTSLVKTKMRELHIAEATINLAVKSLPHLKRWKGNVLVL